MHCILRSVLIAERTMEVHRRRRSHFIIYCVRQGELRRQVSHAAAAAGVYWCCIMRVLNLVWRRIYLYVCDVCLLRYILSSNELDTLFLKLEIDPSLVSGWRTGISSQKNAMMHSNVCVHKTADLSEYINLNLTSHWRQSTILRFSISFP